jgi:hypothetical protein
MKKVFEKFEHAVDQQFRWMIIGGINHLPPLSPPCQPDTNSSFFLPSLCSLSADKSNHSDDDAMELGEDKT